jgi:hypothetical protein
MNEMEKSARSIVQRLADAGFRAVYAGGCVRCEVSQSGVSSPLTPSCFRSTSTGL